MKVIVAVNKIHWRSSQERPIAVFTTMNKFHEFSKKWIADDARSGYLIERELDLDVKYEDYDDGN